MTHSYHPNDLLAMLREQQSLLDQLLEFGSQQLDAIRNNHVSELLAILSQKQPTLDRLLKLKGELDNHRTEIESASFWPSQSLREECRATRVVVSTLFESLIKNEAACEHELSISRDAIRSRLQTLDSGRAAANAYQSNASSMDQLRSNQPRIDFTSVG